MKKYIDKYDKIDAFLAIIKLLEIEGDNPVINKLQDEAITALKESINDGYYNVDWVIMMTIQARKEAREELKKKDL